MQIGLMLAQGFFGLWKCTVYAHRTIELYLKGFLVSVGEVISNGQPNWGHNLKRLNHQCGKHDPTFFHEPFKRRVEYFQRYFDFVRYPSLADRLPKDGSLVWIDFASCVTPLDEVVAFIRPRISLANDIWAKSEINQIYDSKKRGDFQRKALMDHNSLISQILCQTTNQSEINFDENFTADLPGC